jgi:hypothetical protein
VRFSIIKTALLYVAGRSFALVLAWIGFLSTANSGFQIVAAVTLFWREFPIGNQLFSHQVPH